MTVGFDTGQTPLATPGVNASRGARTYARASQSVASDTASRPSPQSAPQSTRITSTRVGLNLGKFQIDYTSHEMTVDLDEVVRDALGARPGRSASFAEELDLARTQQSAQAGPARTSTASDATPTATPGRAALAYARAQGLDTPEAALHSLGSI